MIQRIQSVYLLLAALCAMATLFVPLATFATGAENQLISACGLAFRTCGIAADAETLQRPWGILVCSGLSAVVSLYTIFRYKDRKQQMRFCRFGMAIQAFAVAASGTYIAVFASKHAYTFSPNAGIALPLLAFVFLWLALRGIRKDEALVRAADRIR